MLLCCITLSSSRENQRSAQEVARRISGTVAGEAHTKSSQDLISRQRAISGAVAGEAYAKVNIPSTHHNISRITLFASRFPLPPLHPCRFIRPLFPNLLLSSLALLFTRLVGIDAYLLLNRELKIYGSSSAC